MKLKVARNYFAKVKTVYYRLNSPPFYQCIYTYGKALDLEINPYYLLYEKNFYLYLVQ